MPIGLIYSQKPSSWKSCTKIVANLLASYTAMENNENLNVFHFDKGMSEIQIKKLALIIKDAQVSELIFIDHRPHPLSLIQELVEINALPPKITFHLYGNFMLDLAEWKISLTLLSQTLLKFIAASRNQAKVVESVLEVEKVLVCPFPVNSDTYNYNPMLRKKERDKYNLQDRDLVFIYTGRLSQDKNSIKLLSLFSDLYGKSKCSVKLFLAGKFDDIINPMLRTFHRPNAFQFKFLHHLKMIPKETRNNIHFLGDLSDEQLTRLYNMADIFISLSLYHDEDFGMSPIESLMCGSKAILTDWGGYQSFESDEACSLIDTFMTLNGACFDENKALSSALKLTALSTSRQHVAHYYDSIFSIKAITNLLNLARSSYYFRFVKLSNLGEKLITNENTVDQSFLQVYRSYVTQPKELK